MIPKIEIIIATIKQGEIYYTPKYIDLSKLSVDPDTACHNFITSNTRLNYKECILHSTSWRYKKPNDLVVTHLFYVPVKINHLADYDFSCSIYYKPKENSHYRPRPSRILLTDVVQHAFRHLAHLISCENNNMYSKIISKKEYAVLKKVDALLAGKYESQ